MSEETYSKYLIYIIIPNPVFIIYFYLCKPLINKKVSYCQSETVREYRLFHGSYLLITYYHY